MILYLMIYIERWHQWSIQLKSFSSHGHWLKSTHLNNILLNMVGVGWFINLIRVHVIIRAQFLTKKLSEPGGNISNYFMKIIVFSQLYRSKSATSERSRTIWKYIPCYVFSNFPPNNRVRKQLLRTFEENLI